MQQQQQIYQVYYDVNELKQRLIAVWHRFKQSVITDAVVEWCKRLCACIRVKQGALAIQFSSV